MEVLTIKRLEGCLLGSEHLDWLKAREVVMEAKCAKAKKTRLLARDELLKVVNASYKFFYRALRIKTNKVGLASLRMSTGKF